MKKIFTGVFVLVLVCIFGVLLFFRLKKTEEVDTTTISKIISPVASVEKESSDTSDENTQAVRSSLVPLESTENFFTECDADLNLDGFDDKVVAVRKASDNAIYLIPAISNPIKKTYERQEKTRIEIMQASNLALYALDLGLDEKPAIVCSCTTQDNIQILIIFLLEETKDAKLSLKQTSVFHADIQVRINKNPKAQVVGLGQYSVLCFESDVNAPNTLSQVEKTYTWSEKDKTFQKTNETIIPGEKIEDQILRKIGNGNVKLFREFLQGLWVHQSKNTNSSNAKLLYFNDVANEITFTDRELQEVYVISNVSQRRYGIYFTTYNKSLNTIILRIDIEIKSLNEINVRVVESVTRLKIGAESLWDGVYTKKDNTIRATAENPKLREIENILQTENVVWKNADHSLKIMQNKFVFKTSDAEHLGEFTLMNIKDKIILQLRSNNKNIFYEITTANNSVILNEVEIKLSSVKNLGNEKIILVKSKE
ncbi:MAG: pallilysin-related adhesin [Treponemataceae bacterium]